MDLGIRAEGVRKTIGKVSVEDSFLEYITNSLDAKCSLIKIQYNLNTSGYIDQISIEDNGTGINFEKFQILFGFFLSSEKVKSKNISAVEGEHGYGRLCFDNFSSNVKWETTYQSVDNNYYSYDIKIDSRNLINAEPGKKIKSKKESTGTKVTFSNLKSGINTEDFFQNIVIKNIKEKIARRFLALKVRIYLNGEEITFDDYILDSENIKFNIGKRKFSLLYIQWKKYNKEESRYYCLKSNNDEVYKDTTGLNKNGDQFYHSLYITSEYFDNFVPIKIKKGENPMFTEYLNDNVFPQIIVYITNYLKEKRHPFIKIRVNEYLGELYSSGILTTGVSGYEQYQNKIIEDTITELYEINPKIIEDLGIDQKGIFIRMLVTILQEGKTSNIFNILDKVLNLSNDERERLNTILNQISLKHAVDLLETITSRLQAIEIIKQFVFNKDLDVKEVPDLQDIISEHYRIFGEEYSLLGNAEEDFIENLRKFRKKVYNESLSRKEANIESKDKNKEMDIFLCKTDNFEIDGEPHVKNVIVELKRPSKILNKDCCDQIIKYFSVILKEPRFNGKSFERKFYLIGNKYDSYIETMLSNSTHHGRGVLIKDKNYTIYCKTWSDIINEAESRLKFLKKKLDSDFDNIKESSKIQTKKEGKNLSKLIAKKL